MRFRLMKLGVVFMAGMGILLGGRTVAVQASPLQAGVSAVLSDALSGRANMPQKVSSVNVRSASQEDAQEESSDAADQPDTICGYTNLGVADVDNYLNIRKEASEDAELVGKLPAKAGCELIGQEGDWYYVKSGKVAGYVRSDYVATGEAARQLAEKYKKEVATVNTETLFVREEPNTECTILALVSVGEELEVVSDNGDWIEVKVDDETGYVSAQYVDLSDELTKAITITEYKYGSGVSDVRVSLVQTALSYVGNRYVWGGTSLTNGVDCSGFTMQIFAKYGIYLPHSSRSQAGYGKSISTSELQPGDLIFYGSGSTINHVAIYIGGSRIVHASNSRDGIKVSYAFYRTPICCRRLL